MADTEDETETDRTETEDDSPDEPPVRPPKSRTPAPAKKKAPSAPPQRPPSHPSGPPLGKDGKPLPPPPIIGPDGKEVPRPRDAEGNPLPIYVTQEGEPIFDDKGRPIPLRFDKEGRPVPLQSPDGTQPPPAPPPGGGIPSEEKKKVPLCVFWIGVVDIVLSIALLIFEIIVCVELFAPPSKNEGSNKKDPSAWYIVATAMVTVLGGLFAAVPMVAVKKDQRNLMTLWWSLAFLIAIVQAVICFVDSFGVNTIHEGRHPVVVYYCAIGHCVVRLVVGVSISTAMCCNDENVSGVPQPGQYYNPQGGGIIPNSQYYYPGQGQPVAKAAAPTVQVLQTQAVAQQRPATTTTTTVYQPMVPAYNYYSYPSYGYGGYPTSYGYGGFGMGYGYGAGLGMYGGGYYGYPYHHHHHHHDFWDHW